MRSHANRWLVAQASSTALRRGHRGDLLGGWTLYRESGVQGGRATLKREQFLERDEATVAFEKARDAQLKRGFRVMFAQGQEDPYGR